MKRLLIVSMVIAAFLVMGGFPQKAFSAEEVWLRVGAPNPLSGPGAMWGEPCARGVKIMGDIYNDAGGVKVGNKVYKFKVTMADTKYTAEGGKSAYEKLLSVDKCQFMVGDFSDAPVAIMNPLSTEKKIICLLGSTAIPALAPEFPYVFRFSQDQNQKLDTLRVALKTMPIKTFFNVQSDDLRGRAQGKITAEVVQSLGVKVLGEIFYNPKETNFAPVMTKALTTKPDLLYAGPPGQAALMMKEAHALGFKGFWVSTGSVVNLAQMIQIAGGKEAVENWIGPYEVLDCPIIKDSDKPLLLDIQKRYLKEFKPPFEPLAWRYATGLQILKDAIVKAGSPDPDKVKHALETETFSTFLGEGKFTGQKTFGIAHQFSPTTIAAIVKNGKPEYLGTHKTVEP